MNGLGGIPMGQFSMATVISGLVFGIFGWYIFKHGKEDYNMKRVGLGVVLMAYGIFVPNPWLNWLVGAALLYINYFTNWAA